MGDVVSGNFGGPSPLERGFDPSRPYQYDGDPDAALKCHKLYGVEGEGSAVGRRRDLCCLRYRGFLRGEMRRELARREANRVRTEAVAEGNLVEIAPPAPDIPRVSAVFSGHATVAESCGFYQIGEYFLRLLNE